MKTKLLFLPIITGEASNVLTENKLELDETTQKIYGVIYLPVASNDFKMEGNIELFEVQKPDSAAHGIAFRYVNTVNADIIDNEKENPIQMEVIFEFDNVENWKEDDIIKIISLNEKNHSEFRFLRPYFKERILAYPTQPMTIHELSKFNNDWNNRHLDHGRLQVSTYGDEDKQKDTPKLTKQDMIIRLAKK